MKGGSDWISYALKNLSVEEFEEAIYKATNKYHQGIKILGVTRSGEGVRVIVKTASGERKLVIL